MAAPFKLKSGNNISGSSFKMMGSSQVQNPSTSVTQPVPPPVMPPVPPPADPMVQPEKKGPILQCRAQTSGGHSRGKRHPSRQKRRTGYNKPGTVVSRAVKSIVKGVKKAVKKRKLRKANKNISVSSTKTPRYL